MLTLRPYLFIGPTAEDATAQLAEAIADGTVALSLEPWPRQGMWITMREVIPGAMQQSSYQLHVVAWVHVPDEAEAT